MADVAKIKQATNDWRDPAAYSYTAQHTLDLWAWEFLRRNPDYRRDWNEKLAAYLEYRRGLHPSIQAVAIVEYVDEPDGAEIDAERRWGLMGYCNPSIAIPTDLVFTAVERKTDEPMEGLLGRLYVGHREGGPITIFLPPNRTVAVFDYTMPLEPQLREIERRLRYQQQRRIGRGTLTVRTPRRRAATKTKSERHDLWGLYLRALDADEAGASRREIGAMCHVRNSDGALRPYSNVHGNSAATKAGSGLLKQAQRLRDGGYRDIPPVGV